MCAHVGCMPACVPYIANADERELEAPHLRARRVAHQHHAPAAQLRRQVAAEGQQLLGVRVQAAHAPALPAAWPQPVCFAPRKARTRR